MKHFVYLLECADGSLYAGYTTDVKRRLLEHNGESPKSGARYTSGRRPVRLVFQKVFRSRSEATKYEASLKQLKRKDKLLLIQ